MQQINRIIGVAHAIIIKFIQLAIILWAYVYSMHMYQASTCVHPLYVSATMGGSIIIDSLVAWLNSFIVYLALYTTAQTSNAMQHWA